MNYEAALIQMDCFVEERAYNFHKEAWAIIRAKLAESTNTSTNKQSTPCDTRKCRYHDHGMCENEGKCFNRT